MIILVSFSELECSLFAASSAALKAEARIRCIDGIGSIEDTVLAEMSEHARITYPNAIVLNLDVKRSHWRQNLLLLKNNGFWRRIPVVGVGFLEEAEAVEEFYALGGASCIRKPDSDAAFMDVAKSVIGYWLHVAVLPDQFVEST